MNDQLLMDNYLSILKSNVEVFVHGTLESSNKDVKKILKEGLDMTLTSQESTFDIMSSNNWYKITNVKKDEIKKVCNKCENE